MNEQDKLWLKKCRLNPKRYYITVDNDSITAKERSEADDADYYTFSEWGEEFICKLLEWCGISAERC